MFEPPERFFSLSHNLFQSASQLLRYFSLDSFRPANCSVLLINDPLYLPAVSTSCWIRAELNKVSGLNWRGIDRSDPPSDPERGLIGARLRTRQTANRGSPVSLHYQKGLRWPDERSRQTLPEEILLCTAREAIGQNVTSPGLLWQRVNRLKKRLSLYGNDYT